jgi:excisionase family DNA binding protein
MKLLEANPTTLAAYNGWLREGIAWCEANLADDSREVCELSAKLVHKAKQFAYQLQKVRLADVLPFRPLKCPTDACLRLREALSFFDEAPVPPQGKANRDRTTTEVAQQMGVSPDTVREWIKVGRLRAVNVAKPGVRPSYRITEAALADFDKLASVVKIVERTTRPRITTPKKWF